MGNDVPAAAGTVVAPEVLDRSLAARREAYADEIRRLIDAAYAVMAETGSVDPRVGDIVARSGLSNQAFYRHFRSKDELLVAVLDDGQRRLVSYLDARMRRVPPGAPRIRAWIEGVLEQAVNPSAALNTRPFAINSARLADRFPDITARSRELLLAPLREAVADAGGDAQRDADAIYHLAMGRMQDAIARRERPSREDVDHLAHFVLRSIGA
jgi:AcrR family transcriptional regulator